MNTELIAKIIADALHERPEFANVPIWEPTDEEKEAGQDGDKALLVSVTGGDEIIPGNYTYKISGEILYRQRYAEADPPALVLDVTKFAGACADVLRSLTGRRNGPDDPAAWVVLGSNQGPAIPGTSETYMVFKCSYELFIQF